MLVAQDDQKKNPSKATSTAKPQDLVKLIGEEDSAIISLLQTRRLPTLIVGMARGVVMKQFFETLREAIVLKHDPKLKSAASEILTLI